MKRNSLFELMTDLSSDVEAYGVKITRITVTYAQPPNDFLNAQEGRQLAKFRQSEQMQTQALALQKQRDEAALLQAQLEARLVRDTSLLELQVRQAETRRKVVELEAQSEAFRLAKLQERIKKYPLASRYDFETAQLDVAKSLAGNTRAVLQIGNGGDIARSFIMRDLLENTALLNGAVLSAGNLKGTAVADSGTENGAEGDPS